MTKHAKLSHVPETITIKTPMHTPILRGVHANRGPHACGPLGANIRVRIPRVDEDVVQEAIDFLGMNKAEFLRWCAVHVSREIKKHM